MANHKGSKNCNYNQLVIELRKDGWKGFSATGTPAIGTHNKKYTTLLIRCWSILNSNRMLRTEPGPDGKQTMFYKAWVFDVAIALSELGYDWQTSPPLSTPLMDKLTYLVEQGEKDPEVQAILIEHALMS